MLGLSQDFLHAHQASILFTAVVGVQCRALNMPGKHSTTELHLIIYSRFHCVALLAGKLLYRPDWPRIWFLLGQFVTLRKEKRI